jgi:caffeoyl-CoA O-methyltransferase
VITCDVDPETTAIAKRYAEEAGLAGRIEYRLGPALETLAQLDGPFDLVFIDADKPNYRNYYEAALPKLADDGLLVADNAFRAGRVLDGDAEEPMKEFNDYVRRDSRVECVLLTVRDGMLLVRKR